jgi:hypothetical protein
MPIVKSLLLLFSLSISHVAMDGLPSPGAVQVSVSLVGDDALTQALQVALERHIMSSRELELSRGGGNAFRITTSTNVASGILGGRRVMIYRAMLFRRDEMVVDNLGVCFQRDVGKCADDIIRAFTSVMIDYASNHVVSQSTNSR